MDAKRNLFGIAMDPLQLFMESILDQTKDYPPPVPIINLIHHGSCMPFLTKKSISLWQGKQKSKKSTALALAVAAVIEKNKIPNNIRLESVERGIVLFFDCEQGESYAARTMQMILKIAGLNQSKELIYSDLRKYSPTTRLDIITAAIEANPGVILVVVDGLVDLMDDFMSAEEGHFIITQLLKLASEFNIHIAGVLHQNKGSGRDARAHVGSIASQKCEREIVVEVDSTNKQRSIISSKESRNLPFPDFAIIWEDNELPKIDQEWVPRTLSAVQAKVSLPKDIPIETHKTILKKIFSNNQGYISRADLKQGSQIYIGQLIMTIGVNKVDSYIKYWLESSMISQIGTPGTKSVKYYLKDNNQLN